MLLASWVCSSEKATWWRHGLEFYQKEAELGPTIKEEQARAAAWPTEELGGWAYLQDTMDLPPCCGEHGLALTLLLSTSSHHPGKEVFKIYCWQGIPLKECAQGRGATGVPTPHLLLPQLPSDTAGENGPCWVSLAESPGTASLQHLHIRVNAFKFP